MHPKELRILIAPLEVAGYYQSLTRGFRKIGIKCDFAPWEHHALYYDASFVYVESFLLQKKWKINIKKKYYSQFTALVFYSKFLNFIERILWYLWTIRALTKYNVFIFACGVSLFAWNLDYIILKLLKKKIIINIGHGSDARPPYLNGNVDRDSSARVDAKNLFQLVDKTHHLVLKSFKYATYIVGAPYSTSYFAPKKFVNTLALGQPIDLDKFSEINSNNIILNSGVSKKFNILHAPSHTRAKGTFEIETTIQELSNEFSNIFYSRLEGEKNEKVLYAISQSDLAIDQIFSDFPLPGFASECAALGVPVIVAGYGLRELMYRYQDLPLPPVLITEPENLKEFLINLLNNPDIMLESGLVLKNFIHCYWNNVEVAKRYLKVMTDAVPENYWVNPNDIRYVHGSGQNMLQTKSRVSSLVNYYGDSSLGLDSKPELKKRFLMLIASKK